MNPQNTTPAVVVELTKTYLHNLTDNELQEHFIQLSNKFATSQTFDDYFCTSFFVGVVVV